ncbi:MAG: B12-binding domain-containing protein [Candidatus Methanofastidiosa archaeon]|nr:B12-binding domain-containing protein [Candidatus Methanofastidiosa archaeon]
MTSKEELLEKLSNAVIEGDEDKCAELAESALEAGIDPYEAIMKGCNKGMEIVSHKYECKEMFVPEILLSADAMYAALDVLRPHLKVDEAGKKTGTVVIGVAEGDIHDIGKNLVLMMLDVAGYNIVDVGRDVSADTFVEKAAEVDADLVAMSALMTTSMVRMELVINGLKKRNLKAKVIVGGAPISQSYADKIGADGYGKDAVEAVRVANKLMEA